MNSYFISIITVVLLEVLIIISSSSCHQEFWTYKLIICLERLTVLPVIIIIGFYLFYLIHKVVLIPYCSAPHSLLDSQRAKKTMQKGSSFLSVIIDWFWKFQCNYLNCSRKTHCIYPAVRMAPLELPCSTLFWQAAALTTCTESKCAYTSTKGARVPRCGIIFNATFEKLYWQREINLIFITQFFRCGEWKRHRNFMDTASNMAVVLEHESYNNSGLQ